MMLGTWIPKVCHIINRLISGSLCRFRAIILTYFWSLGTCRDPRREDAWEGAEDPVRP